MTLINLFLGSMNNRRQGWEGLSPVNTVRFAAAYGTWIQKRCQKHTNGVVGRDARISGDMIRQLVVALYKP